MNTTWVRIVAWHAISLMARSGRYVTRCGKQAHDGAETRDTHPCPGGGSMSDTRLTLITEVPGHPRSRALVRCMCGQERIIRLDSFRSGNARSCGCLRREVSSEHGRAAVHGQSSNPTSEYRAWDNAKQRVTNPSGRKWPHYGGRGIGMCAEWLASFAAFFADVGPRPAGGYSLDRIDNDGDYEPGNVRWATYTEQNRNRRRALNG
jgi:hypothetical protein